MAEDPKGSIRKHLEDAVEDERKSIESLRELWNDIFAEKQEPICLGTPRLFPNPIQSKRE